MRFQDIIAPLSIEDFKELIEQRPPYKIWRSTALLENLFNWDKLNSVLKHQRTNEIDVSVLCHNRRVAVQDTTEKAERKFRTINQLNAKKVSKVLHEGGTVRISRIDEKVNSLDIIAADIESELGCQSTMSLYAGFGKAHHALAAHYDRHDVLIVQIKGKKNWEVFGFGTNPYPVQPTEDALSECPSQILWSGELNEGEMLFLPRGSWHRANVITDIPTLQVSIAFHHTMLHELHAWLEERLATYGINNRHLLAWNNEEDSQFERAIRIALEEILSSGFLNTYRRYKKDERSQRFLIHLPHVSS